MAKQIGDNMSQRKFYKTIINVTVLSEEPIEASSVGGVGGGCALSEIAYNITEGDMSGVLEIGETTTLNGKEAADALIEQSSDPEFFQLDANGNDLEE